MGPKSLYYSTWSRAKFHENWQGENSAFLLHFLIHIHVLMLFFNFEPILIKIGIFTNFKVTQKSGQSPCTIVHGLGPNFMKIGKERILHFYYIF